MRRDQRHVAEDVRIAREVEREAVLQLEHDPVGSPEVDDGPSTNALEEWFASVSVIRTPSTSQRAALVRTGCGHPVGARRRVSQPRSLDRRDQRAVEALCDLDRVADVVAVAVREHDQVAALGLALAVGALRVPVEEGIEVDPLAAGLSRRKAECPSQVSGVAMGPSVHRQG